MKTRILLVDDSAVVRRVLSDAIAATDDLEVAAVAATGRIGLAKLPRERPDVVVLDIEMPDMDGLATLTEIRKIRPELPVIMFSSLTRLGAAATLDALQAGANDYCPKPMATDLQAAQAQLTHELFPKIRALVGRGNDLPPRATEPPPAARRAPGAAASAATAVAIGASTGGPNALVELLPRLPGDLPAPVVVVQHMPPVFTRLLAERLAARCKMPVHEVEQGQQILPGNVYIAPGDFHFEVQRRAGGVYAQLHQGPQENSCRPAVDVLFRSVAREYGPGALGVVLTGMGKDGLAGCEHLRERGASILVQDEASSVVWGMPGHVSRARLADAELPLSALATQIRDRVFMTPRAGATRPAAPMAR
jgi:two-component system chemotaxis response regulator CheB